MPTNSNDSGNQEDREASEEGVDVDKETPTLKNRMACYRERAIQRLVGWKPITSMGGSKDE
ncbi:hypothetical protein [Halocalculus aciditolerans]|uniref:Uncharacterized protein n=1 Tax=Halocalculus aciditolerans TaxID=1383812 RepID=A0A830FFE6_9EURY|nr:hypothetical protein [Halocalculus aciditolerans]GGL69255.1 hypothetical protein GCM10009039_29040 [Halocalculus aciditolerans]